MNLSLIGNAAGTVWNLLNNHGKMSIDSIKKSTKLTDSLLYSAMGWLAREDKLLIKDGFVSLK